MGVKKDVVGGGGGGGGGRRWLERNGTPAERDAYAAARQRRADFVRLVLRYRGRLPAFFSGGPAGGGERGGGAKRTRSSCPRSERCSRGRTAICRASTLP